jgi:transposase
MIKNRNYVGIDISKLTFDVAIKNDKGYYLHYKFSNDSGGFSSLLSFLNKENDTCIMEASGPYYLKLATFLHDKKVQVSVINPLVIRRFSQMRMMRTKTDKKDAVMIAEYGKTETPKVWEPEDSYVLELKQMLAYVEQLNKSKTGFIRQQEAFKQNPTSCLVMNKSIAKTIKMLEKEIAMIELKMEALVKEHHQKQFEQLQSIPGLGKKTSMQLIVLSGGFTKFENAKQLSSYVGLSPRIFESGTSVKGKAKICKMGMSRVRAMLYVCAWTAKKCNKACRELYDRLLKNGKAKKLALIAVANKLLKQAFAIATKNEFYLQIN